MHGPGVVISGTRKPQPLEAIPGLLGDLETNGATTGDLGADMLWFHFGGYKDRSRTGLVGRLQSRPLFEGHIHRRCLAYPNIRVQDGGGHGSARGSSANL